MDSLVGYGSEDEVENDRYGNYHSSVAGDGSGGPRRRDDDTNYDDVNMDMSEDSQGESEPELPPAEPQPRDSYREDRRGSGESREHDRRRHESPRRDRRDHKRDERYRPDRNERTERRDSGSGRRGLLGDRPDDAAHDANKVPALMDLKPFGGEAPPSFDPKKSQDARDAVSPRFADRDRERGAPDRGAPDRCAADRRDRDRGRDRDREHRHSRRFEEKKSHKYSERRERSRSRGAGGGAGPAAAGSNAGAAYPPPSTSTSSSSSTSDRPSPTDYRPSSYKVNKKLEVMEKMGLQIKTPDGHMATAQQLRAARGHDPTSGQPLPSYYNPTAVNSNKILDQVQKRKLLWSGKNKNEIEEAAKWSGTRFAQDNDGKQVSKFMRLMGIKEPAAVKPESTETTADPIKKQEELFQAMQAQYEVARATTHTMRGVGLGFQRQY